MATMKMQTCSGGRADMPGRRFSDGDGTR